MRKNQLAPSELVISEDGSIYHLRLRPENIADTIILVGDPGRVKTVSKNFDTIEFKAAKREFHTHTGMMNGKRLTVISTGIGTDNIDIVINELDALANINLKTRKIRKKHKQLTFVRIGTSGSLQAEIPVGSYVLSSHGLTLDALMNYYYLKPSKTEKRLQKAFYEYFADVKSFPSQVNFIAGDKKLMKKLSVITPYAGVTATAPGFYAPQGRELRLKSRLRPIIDRFAGFEYKGLKITNFEMETSAIYGLSQLLGHKALSCNLILANRQANTFIKNQKKAIDKMIKEVLAVLTK